MEAEALLGHLECPVCMLPPRSAPIYQCPTGHLVCSECQPSLSRCPICNVKFRKSLITRDFFAEKVLDKLERKCRFELFDCEFSTSSSDALVEHETQCEQKPPVPVKRKRAAAAIAAQENNEDNEEEDEDEEDDDEEDEGGEDEEDVLEDIFVSNFAFVVVLLRAYMLEFGDVTKHNNMYLEYFLLFLLLVWVYYVWQENGFAMLLDETSPFIAAYFVLVVLCLVSLKALYSDEVSVSELVVEEPPGGAETVDLTSQTLSYNYNYYIGCLKPAVTLLTGLFCCIVHVYVYDIREDSWFALGCVLTLSFLLSSVELLWSLSYYMDQFYYVIFWLQSFFIVLPFGMIGRHFLDFQVN